MQTQRIYISIVNHNNGNDIISLIKSIDTFWRLERCQELYIVIRNNISSKIIFSSEKYRITTVNNKSPLGFGQNHNLNFYFQESDIFIVLNPDVLFIEEFNLSFLIDKPVEFYSIYSPILIKSDGKEHVFFRPNITPYNLLRRAFNINFSRSQKYWLSGAFLIFSSANYNRLRGFDENFFMYVEDCDICIRNIEQGGENVPLKNLKAIHQAQKNSRKVSIHLLWHLKSLIYYWAKSIILHFLNIDIGKYETNKTKSFE